MVALTEGLFSTKDPKAYYTNIANLLGKLQPVVLDNYVRTKDKSHFFKCISFVFRYNNE